MVTLSSEHVKVSLCLILAHQHWNVYLITQESREQQDNGPHLEDRKHQNQLQLYDLQLRP